MNLNSLIAVDASQEIIDDPPDEDIADVDENVVWKFDLDTWILP